MEGGHGQDQDIQEEWFRVSVSLAQYFPGADERARCYMAAWRGRRVRWLARRVRRTFALRGRVALTARGHLLPPGEPLALLSADDEIQVIPATGFVRDMSRRPAPCAPLATPSPHFDPSSAQDDIPPPLPPDVVDLSLEKMKRRALDLLESSWIANEGEEPSESQCESEPMEHHMNLSLEGNHRAIYVTDLPEYSGKETEHDPAPICDTNASLELSAPRRRRRVRRRRRALPATPPPPPSDHVDGALSRHQADDDDSDEPRAGAEASLGRASGPPGEVIRNESGGPRAPRRVCALGPDAAPTSLEAHALEAHALEAHALEAHALEAHAATIRA